MTPFTPLYFVTRANGVNDDRERPWQSSMPTVDCTFADIEDFDWFGSNADHIMSQSDKLIAVRDIPQSDDQHKHKKAKTTLADEMNKHTGQELAALLRDLKQQAADIQARKNAALTVLNQRLEEAEAEERALKSKYEEAAKTKEALLNVAKSWKIRS